MNQDFDIKREFEIAAKVKPHESDLAVLWSLKEGSQIGGYDDGKGGLVVPFVWSLVGKFIPGFEHSGHWVQFVDWSADDLKHGMLVSGQLAGLHSEVLRGLR